MVNSSHAVRFVIFDGEHDAFFCKTSPLNLNVYAHAHISVSAANILYILLERIGKKCEQEDVAVGGNRKSTKS